MQETEEKTLCIAEGVFGTRNLSLLRGGRLFKSLKSFSPLIQVVQFSLKSNRVVDWPTTVPCPGLEPLSQFISGWERDTCRAFVLSCWAVLRSVRKKLFTLGILCKRFLARTPFHLSAYQEEVCVMPHSDRPGLQTHKWCTGKDTDKVLIHIKVKTHTYKMTMPCDGVERGRAWVEYRIGTNSLQVSFFEKGHWSWTVGSLVELMVHWLFFQRMQVRVPASFGHCTTTPYYSYMGFDTLWTSMDTCIHLTNT